MNMEPSEKAEKLGLRFGEWQLFCPNCDYKAEKMTAQTPICPKCRSAMHIASEKQEKK